VKRFEKPREKSVTNGLLLQTQEVKDFQTKNRLLLSQIRKTLQTLKDKDEVMGEGGLGQIDFDQLRIENKQYFEKIQEKNHELLKLKLTSGSLTQVRPLPPML